MVDVDNGDDAGDDNGLKSLIFYINIPYNPAKDCIIYLKNQFLFWDMHALVIIQAND